MSKEPFFKSKVLGPLIVIGVSSAAATFIGWKKIGSAIADAWIWLWWETATIPGWLLVILSFCALVCLGLGAVCIWAVSFNEKVVVSEEKTAVILGVRWRWVQSADGRIGNLSSYCPHCDISIGPKIFGFDQGGRFEYECEECRKFIAADGSHQAFRDRILRKIDQALRTGRPIEDSPAPQRA